MLPKTENGPPLGSVHRQRNDDRRTVGLGSTRGRHIPADGRQETVSNHRHCRGYGLGLFQFSLRGGSSPGLREGDRLIPSKRSVATLTPVAGRRLSAFQSARLFRAVQFQLRQHVTRQSPDAAECHSSNAFRGGCFDAVHSTRRLIANDQFIVGEIRNV